MIDLPLFAYATAPHNGTETSVQAASSIKPHVNRLGRQVLDCIAASPAGMTCDEVEAITHLAHQTCSARFRDLATCQPPAISKVLLEDGTYLKRRTRSGRFAFVYVATGES